MPKVTIPSPVDTQEGKTIKFDMKIDDESRASARKGYEVAKVLKEAGLKFRKVIPAHNDPSIRKLFKLGPTGPNFCLEISLNARTAEDNTRQIDEIKDQFLLMPDFTLVNDKPYKLDKSTTVHRFLFRPSKINK